MTVAPATSPSRSQPLNLDGTTRGDDGQLARLTAATALGVALLAAGVLAGRALDVPVMSSGPEGLVTMKVNTAVCFLLLAVAIGLLRRSGRRRRRFASLLLATAAGLVAVLTLSEYVLGRNLAIDGVLLREAGGALQPSGSERMAPNSAAAFILLAAAIVSANLRSRLRGWVTAGLALAAGLLALVALVGYVSGVTSLYAVTGLADMALPTAGAFIALAASVICSRPEEGPMPLILSDTFGGRVVRVLFPATLIVPLILTTLRLAGQSAGLFDSVTGTWLFALAVMFLLTPLTWTLGASLDRAERASARARVAREETQREKAAFDNAPIGSALVSLDGRFTRVNRALCVMTGYSSDELATMCVSEITHADDRVSDAAGYAALADRSVPVRHADTRYTSRDGSTIYARVAVTAIRDGGGSVSHFYAQIQDVTENKTAARRLEEAQFETLTRLAAAAEYRDDATGEHTRRVGELAAQLGARLGLPPATVELIRLAAPLHDVGKIGIPDSILLKPGKLTQEEFAEMKRHTSIGAQMLSGSIHPQIAMAGQIAASHHERWDGTGYPAGLAGEAIPLPGRIVAVADVFDALTHERPYKSAWAVRDALAELGRQRGRQFDPQVVDAMFDLVSVPSSTGATPAAARLLAA